MQRINRTDPVSQAAAQRLSIALTLSLVVHAAGVWMVPGRGDDSDLPEVLAQVVPPRMFTFSASLLPVASTSNVSANQRSQVAAAGGAGRVDAHDPRYYGVDELDVLPTPRGPIRLRQEAGLLGTGSIENGATGKVRLLARIDASGRITGLFRWGSDTAEQHYAAALQALGDTPFNAARKDGRPVRSEVVIELAAGSAKD